MRRGGQGDLKGAKVKSFPNSSLNATFNEHENGKCLTCGSKTMLVSALAHWVVDEEAFVAGEYTAEREDVPKDVEVGAELTGSWCNLCGLLTSLTFNQIGFQPTAAGGSGFPIDADEFFGKKLSP